MRGSPTTPKNGTQEIKQTDERSEHKPNFRAGLVTRPGRHQYSGSGEIKKNRGYEWNLDDSPGGPLRRGVDRHVGSRGQKNQKRR
jgi:hypothetical protein